MNRRADRVTLRPTESKGLELLRARIEYWPSTSGSASVRNTTYSKAAFQSPHSTFAASNTRVLNDTTFTLGPRGIDQAEGLAQLFAIDAIASEPVMGAEHLRSFRPDQSTDLTAIAPNR